jgi:hypothetical protein
MRIVNVSNLEGDGIFVSKCSILQEITDYKQIIEY